MSHDRRDDDRDDDRELGRALGELPAAEPPAGFADRVLAARAAGAAPRSAEPAARPTPARGTPLPPAPERRRRYALFAAVVAVGVAAAAGLLVFTRDGGRPPAGYAGGAQGLAERRSLPIGKRAIAVAEPGASLTWKLAADGGGRVVQDAGDVFYRVERGGTFVVDTPAGQVTVLGTCFRVEVNPMHPKLKTAIAAGAGAVATAAVLVTVYEGKVRVGNDHGRVDVQPGEQALLAADRPPERGSADAPLLAAAGPAVPVDLGAPPAGATREELLARDGQHRETIAALDARVKRLEVQLGAARKEAERRGGGLDERKFRELTPQDWAGMAERCEVRFDLPSFGLEPPVLSPERAAKAGLSDDERRQFNELAQRENSKLLSELRVLYVEVTGDTAGAETLEPWTMINEIEQKTAGGHSAARRRIALERAGKLTPPADPSQSPPLERLLRLLVSMGGHLEGELAKIVGPERAAAFRDDGFGHKSAMSGCEGGEEK